jgi:VanZ family protein
MTRILIASVTRFWFSSVVAQFKSFLKYWLPVLLWMSLIFTGSTDSHSSERSAGIVEPILHWLFPRLAQTRIDDIHHVIRKCAHLTEYAILALLVWRALNQTKNNLPAWSWPKVGGTLLVVFLYASTDEIHQLFVPTRTGQFSDVMIDTTGAAIGMLALWLFQHFKKRFWPRQK